MQRVTGSMARVSALGELTWNADLIAFEGPLLSLFQNDRGKDILVSWLDADDKANRWACFEVHRSLLNDYLRGDVTLLETFQDANRIYVFDVDAKLKRKNVRLVSFSQLPEDYVPAPDSYLTSEIATDAVRTLVLEKPSEYRIPIDGEWYLEELGTVPRLYQQLYSFHYALEYLGRPVIRHKVGHLLSELPWKGGFSTVSLFTGLSNVTPSIHKVRVTELQYASPGHIRLELLPSIASSISKAFARLQDKRNFDWAKEFYSETYKFLEANKLLNVDQRNLKEQLGEAYEPLMSEVDGRLTTLLEIFDLTKYKDRLIDAGASEIATLKSMLSYYRRMARLLTYASENLLEIPLVD